VDEFGDWRYRVEWEPVASFYCWEDTGEGAVPRRGRIPDIEQDPAAEMGGLDPVRYACLAFEEEHYWQSGTGMAAGARRRRA